MLARGPEVLRGLHLPPVIIVISVLSFLMGGCSLLWSRPTDPPNPPLKVLVAQIILDAPITKSTQIYSFDSPPSPEIEPTLRAQLIEEVELHAQRVLTEQIARQQGFQVLPFGEARRLRADLGSPATPLTEDQLRDLGRHTGADLVVSGSIHDYGALRWQHWVTGWLSVASAHTTVVGALTGWNPIAMGAYLAYDLATDLPLWYGGAYVFGWAFRPVHVEVEARQLTGCEMRSWSDQELVILSRKALAAYPPEERKRKEIQLQVNLEQALQKVAEAAGQELRLKPCREDGNPAGSDGRAIPTLPETGS